MTERDDFDDGTTSFGDAPVDGLVFLPPSDSPELRMKPRQPRRAPAPNITSTRPSSPPSSPAPDRPWTPGPAVPADAASPPSTRWRTVGRVAATVGLALLPLLAAAWLVRIGLNLIGG